MTKFFVTLFAIAALCGNAMAQDNVSLPSSSASAGEETQGGSAEDDSTEPLIGFDRDTTYARCRAGDLEACCDDYADCEEQQDRIGQMWTNAHGQTFDQVAAADCRSRRGTWQQDGRCTCAEPNHWFGTSEASEQCCTPNVRRYENHMQSCLDSGGSWSCRGGCRCPIGTQLLDGECEGEAATREEVDQMRNRIPELERQRADIQRQLEAAQADDEAQAGQIAELERQLEATNGELDNLRELLALREEQLRVALGRVPPAPLPGTAEAVAAAAGGTEPGPMEPLPPPEAEEGNWCEENGWACAGIIVGALAGVAGVTVGIVEATRDIPVIQ